MTAATLDDVKGFFHEYYVPANAIVTIVGDFKTDQAKALVQKYFGNIPAGHRASVPKAPPATLTKIVHVTHTDDVKLPRVYLAWHSPPLYKKGDAELDLLGSVLSDGKTSRLYQPLVFDKKIAKDVSAYQVSMRLGSYFVVQATAAPGVSLDKLSTELLSTLKKALSTPPSKDEMMRAVNAYKKSFYQRLEGVTSRAATLATYYQFTGNADYLDQDLGRYVHATPADVLSRGQELREHGSLRAARHRAGAEGRRKQVMDRRARFAPALAGALALSCAGSHRTARGASAGGSNRRAGRKAGTRGGSLEAAGARSCSGLVACPARRHGSCRTASRSTT